MLAAFSGSDVWSSWASWFHLRVSYFGGPLRRVSVHVFRPQAAARPGGLPPTLGSAHGQYGVRSIEETRLVGL